MNIAPDRKASILLDWPLVLLPICGALGPYLLPVPTPLGVLYLFRALIPVAFLWVLARRCAVPARLDHIAIGFAAGALSVWLIVAAFGLSWVRSSQEALQEVASLLVGACALMVIVLGVAGHEGRWRLLAIGWTLALLVTLAIGGWEIATLHHLPSYYLSRLGPIDKITPFAAATFGNPNNFASFLVIALPAAVAVFGGRHGLIVWLLLLGLIVAVILVIVLNHSRLPLVALALELILLVRGILPGVRRQLLLALMLVAALTIALRSERFVASWKLLLADLTIDRRDLAGGGSGFLRMEVHRAGADIIERSHGLGAGPGSFAYEVRRLPRNRPSYAVDSPHDFALEIAAQYGLAVLLIVLVAAALLLLHGLIRWRTLPADLVPVVLALVIGYVAASFENSGFVALPFNWLAAGTAIAGIGIGRRSERPMVGSGE